MIGSLLSPAGAMFNHACNPYPATSALELNPPLPHLHRDWAHPHVTSAPGLGSPPCHICTGTGLGWDAGSPNVIKRAAPTGGLVEFVALEDIAAGDEVPRHAPSRCRRIPTDAVGRDSRYGRPMGHCGTALAQPLAIGLWAIATEGPAGRARS